MGAVRRGRRREVRGRDILQWSQKNRGGAQLKRIHIPRVLTACEGLL